jgi:hypothetical protein
MSPLTEASLRPRPARTGQKAFARASGPKSTGAGQCDPTSRTEAQSAQCLDACRTGRTGHEPVVAAINMSLVAQPRVRPVGAGEGDAVTPDDDSHLRARGIASHAPSESNDA